MFEFPNEVKRIPIWMPKKVVNMAVNKLVNDYNKLTSKEKVDNGIDSKLHAVSLEVRMQLFVVLYHALKDSVIAEVDPVILELYKKHFKKDFVYTDLESITKKIDKLQAKYKGVVKSLDKPNKKFDFVGFVSDLEGHLKPEKIGKEKLYKMPYYIKKVNKLLEKDK
jgi:hypothetical protein